MTDYTKGFSEGVKQENLRMKQVILNMILGSIIGDHPQTTKTEIHFDNMLRALAKDVEREFDKVIHD